MQLLGAGPLTRCRSIFNLGATRFCCCWSATIYGPQEGFTALRCWAACSLSYCIWYEHLSGIPLPGRLSQRGCRISRVLRIFSTPTFSTDEERAAAPLPFSTTHLHWEASCPSAALLSLQVGG